MHLKNYSLIFSCGKYELAPAYDFLNTTIALAKPQEESALPLNGKKRNLTNKDLMQYLPKTRLKLTDKTMDGILKDLKTALDRCDDLMATSFLSDSMKNAFLKIVTKRRRLVGV